MLEALEAFGPAAFLRTSLYLYPLVNLIHVLAIGALVTSAVLMDVRVLGLGRGIPVETVVRYLRPLAAGALVVAVVTGVSLFSVRPVEYFANPAFRIKMLFLVLAIGNAAIFTTFRAHRRPERPIATVMALASIGLWIAVALSGRFIGFLG